MRKILEDLIFTGKIEESITLFGKSWTLQTLSYDEYIEAVALSANYDTLTRVNYVKLEILARSLKAVDDDPLTDTKENLEFVKQLQIPVINKLYAKYEDIQKKQDESLKDLDEVKNS